MVSPVGCLAIAALALAAASPTPPTQTLERAAPYEGFQFWSVFPENDDQLQFITSQEQEKDLELLNNRAIGKMDLMISPALQNTLKERLNERNITFAVTIEDLQAAINEENPLDASDFGLDDRLAHRMDWFKYHRLSDIYAYMDYLADMNPEIVEIISIGQSSEGRDLRVMRISSDLKSTDRPSIWIDGGIHAREWISPAVVTNIIHRLVEFSENSYLHNSVDWFILPVHNPDGYEYSHTNQRMWRKNRAKTTRANCIGVDLNRNYDYKWGGKGTSKSDCSEIYRGTKGFSEPESRAVSDFILARASQFKLFLTVHSYGQYILIPYGYEVVFPSDYKDLKKMATKAASKMKTYPHTVGNSADLLYPAAGGSDDWAKGVAGIKYSYTVELAPSSTGGGGFILPASEIQAVCDDFFPAVQSFGEQIVSSL